MKLTLKMRKLIEKKEKDIDYIKKMNLRRFHRNVQKIKNNQNARIIQRFIKVKLRKYFDKRKLILKGADELNTYIKKQCLFNIKQKAKENLIKSIIPKIKQNEAAMKLIFIKNMK